MNSQPEASSDAAASCAESVSQSIEAEQSASAEESLPLKASETAAAKQPTLLDRFYYWVLSRS
jgi:hypothetical protein